MPMVTFQDMAVDQATHDVAISLLGTTTTTKIQSLVVPVPFWSAAMEGAFAQCVGNAKTLHMLRLDKPCNLVQHLADPGQMLLHAYKEGFATTTIMIFDDYEPYHMPTMNECTSLFGADTSSLIYIHGLLNKLGRKRSVTAAPRMGHSECYRILDHVSKELDCLFVHLKEIPGIFGEHALRPPSKNVAVAAAAAPAKS